MSLTVTTPPTIEPLTLEEVKINLHFPIASEDLLILDLIKAAREYVENYTGRALLTQTIRYTLDSFPGYRSDYLIRLPRPPVQSVTSVSYLDTAEVSQTLVANTDYRADLYSEPARIEPIDSWPSSYERLNAVTVIYVAGHTSANLVSARIKQAMHLLIAHWFVNREATVTGTIQTATELAVQSLLDSAWSGSMAGTYS